VLCRSDVSALTTRRNTEKHPHVEEIETLGLELDLASRSGVSYGMETKGPRGPTFSYSVIHIGARPSSWTNLNSFRSRSNPG